MRCIPLNSNNYMSLSMPIKKEIKEQKEQKEQNEQNKQKEPKKGDYL